MKKLLILLSILLLTIVVNAQIPPIFIPTAFSPNSQIEKNRIFKPISKFGDIQSYKFSIFNKNGELLYTTKDTTNGWDGTYHGTEVQGDVFVYQIVIKYNDMNETTLNKKGTVHLIKK